jgi:predicted protein tyrosine phosphatase
MPKLFVLSLNMVEDIRYFSKETLVISITSSANTGGKLARIEGKYVYRFEFNDIYKEYFLEHKNLLIRPIEKEVAEEIVDVVMNNKDKKVWVIHCEAGISRSPAVAIALAKFFKFDNEDVNSLKKKFPSYNKYVKNMIEEVMIEKLKDEDKAIEIGG